MLSLLAASFLVTLIFPAASLAASLARDKGSADKINVHIIAHTHDDVGWKKTVDEYYYGSNQTIAKGAVQEILDTVVMELSNDPAKRFIYVEIAFFYRWWREQVNATKTKVVQLVSEGRLEFINGGWCMNDEAGAHYNAIIDQMTLGLSLIAAEFGAQARPRVAWQIDPFGHSSTQASLFADMGYDGLYFARADYEDKALRINESRAELVWRGSPRNRGAESDLFTGMFYLGYGSPQQFCFDQRCGNPVVMQDDPLLEDYNVKLKVDEFVNLTYKYSQAYRTNNVMITMGSDFAHANSHQHFKNIDKLIKYLAVDGRVNAFYSTPSKYLDAVNSAGLEWELKTDDFFPYADRPHAYWTGYFTSRPALKRYVRKSNGLLQVCKQIEAAESVIQPFAYEPSFALRQAMGVAQHHDAVSGTEQQHVADDYAKRLAIGSVQCEDFLASWAARITGQSSSKFFTCDLLNISVCPDLDNAEPFEVHFYNPLIHSRSVSVCIPVTHTSYELTPSTAVDVVPISEGTKHVRGDRGNATHELIIMVSLSPTSMTSIQIKPKTERSGTTSTVLAQEERPVRNNLEDTTISNEFLRLTFSSESGRLTQIKRLDTGLIANVDQKFLWYQSFNGTKKDKVVSGAYIFRPANDTALPVNSQTGKASLSIVSGNVVQEVRQQFSPWVYQTVRLHAGRKYAEFEFTVGPIPVADKEGKEVISRFDTDLHSDDVFYTDANGREMQVRAVISGVFVPW